MDSKKRPAIIAVGYNRIDSLYRLLSSIAAAEYEGDDITLIISLDKSDIEARLVELCEKFEWKHGEKIIRTFETRQGLKAHILSCGDLSERYGAVIILEDDLVVSPGYYRYIERAIDYYKDDEEITGLALYSHKCNGYAQTAFEPVHNGYDNYLGQFGVSWGQCWTYKQWSGFRKWYDTNPSLEKIAGLPPEVLEWDDKSWNKYFCYYTVTQNKFYVMPYEALSTCFSEKGEHAEYTSSVYQVPLQLGIREYSFAPVDEANRYDMYFEYIFKEIYVTNRNNDTVTSENDVESISGDKICVDLNCHKSLLNGEKYLLTTGECNYRLVKKYALEMRPMEQNILLGIDGSGINLYELPENEKEIAYLNSDYTIPRIHYEMEMIPWRRALRYVSDEIRHRFKRHF